MKARDDTRVMVRPSLDDFTAPVLPHGYRLERPTHHAFAELMGGFRGFALSHRQAHAERLEESTVAFSRLCAARPHARAIICRQTALEAELIGVHSRGPSQCRSCPVSLCSDAGNCERFECEDRLFTG
jgi:hypothetical protein